MKRPGQPAAGAPVGPRSAGCASGDRLLSGQESRPASGWRSGRCLGTPAHHSALVLTEGDYQRRYHESTAGEALLSVLFTAYPFLFVGFSFSDMDMMGVFRGTMARLRLRGALHRRPDRLGPAPQRY